MRETNYSFVGSPSTYKEMLGRNTGEEESMNFQSCKSYCSDELRDASLTKDCERTVTYLSSLSENTYLDSAHSCIYLYYWIYKDVLNKIESKYDTTELYQKFLSVYAGYGNDSKICDDYKEYINKNIFEKIEKLIDLHENFQKFENSSQKTKDQDCKYAKTCSESYNLYATDFCKDGWNPFCVELENFKEKYDAVMKSVTICGEEVPRTLPSMGGNSIATISVPVVMVLLMSTILFILYKFKLLPSWMQNRVRSTKIIQDYIGQEEYEPHQTSEASKTNPKVRPYNLAYQSVECT
ncbi:PIR Superfamily Protein [Plasmodium ovale wallikeri]|uniref:PIR Superfamily Protein n=1 Tax=Plasmodium ovale wallikeri TaxID=864142 RepID=A0A1A9APH4_PLAOA|nr:PIR Superfamily Protein [Plasmodium ovale wallikeri]